MTEWITFIMEKLGYLGIAFLMFLDNVFPPVPSEIIMPSAGYSAAQGSLTFIGIVLAGSMGSLLAAAVLYALGRKIPNEHILQFTARYGKYLFIQPHDVEKSLNWFEQYGHRIVFFGRMIPAARSLISIPAGMSGMPFGKFMLYSAAGTIIWTTFLAAVGYYFGHNPAFMQQIFSRVGFIILIIILVFIGYLLYRRQQHKAKHQAQDEP